MKDFFKKIFSTEKKSYSVNEIMQMFLGASANSGVYKNWIYVCVDKIADVISKTEFQLMKTNSKGEQKEVKSHSFLDIFYKPNNYQTLADFLYVLTSWLEIKGNVYILRKRNSRNSLKTDLHILNSDSVTFETDDSGFEIKKYTYRTKKGEVTYLPEQIIHIKYPNPYNAIKGVGTIERIKGWTEIDDLSLRLATFMFKNGSVLGGVINAETNNKEELEEIARAFRERTTGVEKAGSVPVLPKGVTYNPIASSPKEMQITEQEKLNVDRILKAFGVSRGILGEVDGTGRANVEMEQYMFSSQTIHPKLERIVDYFNEFLIPSLFPNEDVFLTFTSPVPADKSFELEKTKTSLGGKAWKTVNEVRQEQGLESIEGGDELSSGNPLFDLSKNKTFSKKNLYFANKKMIKAKEKAEEVDEIADKITEELQDKWHKEFVSRVESQQEKLVKTIIDFDLKKQKELKKKLKNKKSVNKSFYTEVKENIKEVFANYKAELFVTVAPILYKISDEEGKANMKLVSEDGVFDNEDKKLLKTVEEVATVRGELFSKTTQKKLLSELKESEKAGEDQEQYNERVDKVFDLTGDYRGARLGQDIAFAVANTSIENAYLQSGVVVSKKWYTALDERVCPFCNSMHGKTMSLEKHFYKKGDVMKVDGETMEVSIDVRTPPLHPSCRCFIIPDKLK